MVRISNERLTFLSFYAVTVLPFVTAACRALAADWVPIGDRAFLYLRAGKLFTPHHPMLGSELVFDIYQAHALMFPLLLGIVLLIGVLTQHSSAGPPLVAVTSLLIQTHVAHMYLVAIFGVFAVAMLAGNIPRRRFATVISALRSRTAKTPAGVLSVAWVEPTIEQLFGEGYGTLARLPKGATCRRTNGSRSDSHRVSDRCSPGRISHFAASQRT